MFVMSSAISITGYDSTLYIGIAMVFVFSPYIWNPFLAFSFKSFNDFVAICVGVSKAPPVL